MGIIFPPSNLPVVSQRWGNMIQSQLSSLQDTITSFNNNADSANKAQNSTMKVLANKIADVQNIVNDSIATASFDAAVITTGTLARPINTSTGQFSALTVGGSGATIGGPVSASGGVSGSDLYTSNGPGFNITAGRVAAWLQNSDGRVGTATSSRRYKTAIEDAATDPMAILGVSVKYYQYKAEVAKRDDPNSEGYVGPDYHVAINIGMIAEDLHEAGLWEFVVYQRDKDDNLVLDENGAVIPDGIHYEIFGLAVLVAAQSLNTRLIALEERVNNLEGKA